MQPYEYHLLDADTAATVMAAKDDILTVADGILDQAGDKKSWRGIPGVLAVLTLMREHRAAVGMAEEIMLAHEGENPADELLHAYAGGLMLWHLRELARLTETEIPS